MVNQTEDTPGDQAAARAVQAARRYAMISLGGIRLFSVVVVRLVVFAVGLSLALNVAVWVYVLRRLPP